MSTTENTPPRTKGERDAAVKTYWKNVKSSWFPGDYELQAWKTVIRSKGWEPCRLSLHQMRESLKRLIEWSETKHDHTWQSTHRTEVFRRWLQSYEEGDTYEGPSFPAMPALDTTVESLEAKLLSGEVTVDHPLQDYKDRPYGRTWMQRHKDDPGALQYSQKDLIEILKKLHGQTIVRVVERVSKNGDRNVFICTEPAYTTESGIKAARTQWLEWECSLHNREHRDYLKFYKTK